MSEDATDASDAGETAAEERPPTPGLHHVSVLSGEPARNRAFYTGTLGLRFVKRTVNFDEKFSHHLYYGDDAGTPGTLLTCFPAIAGPDGRVGHPQPSATALAVPEGSLTFWHERLEREGAVVGDVRERFGERVLPFEDPDGLRLELVERGPDRLPTVDGDTEDLLPRDSPVPDEHAVRCLDGVTLLSTDVYRTAATLEVLGLELTAQEGDRVRYRAPGDYGAVVDLLDVPVEYGREGDGVVHHVAFRAGEGDLAAWRERLLEAGLEPTWIRDRTYFRSVYFREPGGILFEVATEAPGMTVDEPRADLGSALQLPEQFEPDREMIEAQLPPLDGDGE